MSSQTASIMVTDLVGSTELRVRLGEERAEDLRRAHDRLVGDIVIAHGGHVVKGMGDGVLASFSGAADALGAAVSIQQRVGPSLAGIAGGEHVRCRIGLSAGDVTVEDGDCFGTPVVEAARLCAAAEPGGIQAADVVVVLARGRGGHRLEAVGLVELKGMPQPVLVHRVLLDEGPAVASATRHAELRFRVLGGLDVRDGQHSVELGGRKQRAVLAALLLELGHPVPPARLIDLVWGEHVPASAEGSLQAYVANLRRALEPARRPREPARVLVTEPAGYVLVADRSHLDSTHFEDLAAAGHRLLADGDPSAARAALDAALDAWTGPLLPELSDVDWVLRASERLDRARAQVHEDRAEAGLLLGEDASLIPLLQAAIDLEPYHERLRAQLALALYRAGRQRDALAAMHDARLALVEEVGIEPGPELKQLEADMLAQAPALSFTPLDGPATARRPASPATPRPAGSAPLPIASTGAAFVGRDVELAVLLDAYAHAAAGEGRPVVVCGEPGIGKTRIVEELVARVPEAVVAWGRCPETAMQAAYWPCIQIGRQLEGADALDGAKVSELLPEDDLQDLEGTAERLWLHIAVAKVLGSARHPLVLVVDDLQWADSASLRVIEYVAAELRSTSVLLVVTVRPVGADAPPALVDCLGELARQPGAARIDLTGLGARDVERWIEGRWEGRADPDVAALIADRTGGNPFFVGELVELLDGEHHLDGAGAAGRSSIPAAVQDVVRRRLNRLPVTTQQVLGAASVVGRTFDADVVGVISGLAPLEVLEALEPAMGAGLVLEGGVPGRLQFAHVIVADTLVAELSTARRARLHAATAGAISQLRAADLEGHVEILAHHALEGALAGTAEQAYQWSERAARHASVRLAHDDAAEHWGRAIRALEIARPGDRRTRAATMLEQGRAYLRVDDVGAGYVALVAAIDLAIEIGDQPLLASAAAAMNVDALWMAGEMGATAVDAVGALERALAAMSDEITPERVLAMGALGDNAYWQWPPERLDRWMADTLACARQLGDPEILGRSLHKRAQALWWAATDRERRESAQELAALADGGELPPHLEALAMFDGAATDWQNGDMTSAARRLKQARSLAARVGLPALITQLGFFQGALETWFGRLDAADAAVEEAYQLYRRTRRREAESIRAGYRMVVLTERDQLDVVLAEHRDDLLLGPYAPWFREGLALSLTISGRPEEAGALVGGQLPPMIDCWLYVGVLCAAAHTRHAIGDVDAAAVIRDRLVPLAGRMATVGTGAAFGDVDMALARLEQRLGDPGAARHHANRSVALLTAAGEGPWLVRSLLLRHELNGDDADRERAVDIVERLDLPLLRRQLQGG